MTAPRLTPHDLNGVVVMLPTPANEHALDVTAKNTVDLNETARAVDALIADGVDAIMLNGTMGEGPLLLDDEWQRFTAGVVNAAAGRVPVIAGATALNTRDTIRRARIAADLGAVGVLLGRPMWNEVTDTEALAYYRDVAVSVPELGIVVYHNPSSFKHRITPMLWQRLADIDQVAGAKFGLVNDEWATCVDLVEDGCRLMVMDRDWQAAWERRPEHAIASWSIGACGGPRVVTTLRDALRAGDVGLASRITDGLHAVYEALIPEGDWGRFRLYSMQLEKLRVESAGYMRVGPTRPPYTDVPSDIERCAQAAADAWQAIVDELTANQESLA